MNKEICILDEKHLQLVDAFSCIETDDELKDYRSKEKKRIKTLSKDMDDFLRNEAYEDQEKGLSKTHLLILTDDDGSKRIGAYISLCNDSVRLEGDELASLGYPYSFIPSMKIARLAVDKDFKHKGLGKYMVDFAALMGLEIRNICGLAFINLDCYNHRKSYYEKMRFVPNKLQQYEEPHLPTSMRIVLDDYLESLI